MVAKGRKGLVGFVLVARLRRCFRLALFILWGLSDAVGVEKRGRADYRRLRHWFSSSIWVLTGEERRASFGVGN